MARLSFNIFPIFNLEIDQRHDFVISFISFLDGVFSSYPCSRKI